MIKLTQLDGSEIYINPDLIETIEETPDTHITLMNGDRFLVLDKARMIVDKIVVFKARIIHRAETVPRRKFLKKQKVEHYLPVRKQGDSE
jgi:flagellar protein FlbD